MNLLACREDESADDIDLLSKERLFSGKYAVDEAEVTSNHSDEEIESEDDGNETSWLDGSTLIAQYEEEA